MRNSVDGKKPWNEPLIGLSNQLSINAEHKTFKSKMAAQFE